MRERILFLGQGGNSMSFTNDVKTELLQKKLKKDSEKLAFITAVIHQCGSIHIYKKDINFELESDNLLLIQTTSDYIKEIFKLELELEIKNLMGNSNKTCKLILPVIATKVIANATGLIRYINDTAVGFADGITIDLANLHDAKAYMEGIILSSARITAPHSTEEGVYVGGYHFEFSFASQRMAEDIKNYFFQFGIELKSIMRGEFFGLYIKGSETLSDILAYLGANEAVLDLNNRIATKSIQNKINRNQNCILANIDKAVIASEKQIQAIKIIQKYLGLENLRPKLREICEIRLANPDYNLRQIAEELPEKLLKSGVNHRFNAICAIAEELKKQHE